MQSTQDFDHIYSGMSKEEKGIVDAIRAANSFDEKGLIDNIIKDVQERRARLFDVIYIDLSIDRSTQPLELSGAGTVLIGLEATDNNSSCDISFELPADANNRISFKRGKRFFGPYSKIYIYHSAQSGKYLKLMRGFGTRSIFAGFEDDSGETANSDLVTALGNSSAIATGQISVGTSSTVIKAANTNRKRITIKVPASAANPVYIGVSGVTTGDGHCLDPGDAITLNTTDAIYGDAAAATTVTYLEE